jgi:hypothetical protein
MYFCDGSKLFNLAFQSVQHIFKIIFTRWDTVSAQLVALQYAEDQNYLKYNKKAWTEGTL